MAEWLPQIVSFVISDSGTDSFFDSCASARLWSRRVMAVKRSAGTSGAAAWAISALVLAGLPTTSTFTSRDATASSALPCTVKIWALASSRSLRSMPGPRGRAPTSSATWQSRNATRASSVAVTLLSPRPAQSASHPYNPFGACSAGRTSRTCSITG